MALIKTKHLNDLEAITVKNADIMLVRKTNRFMLLPISLKKKLDTLKFNQELQENMDSSAEICREHIQVSDIDVEMLVENQSKPVHEVQVLPQFYRIVILRDGKTLSFANYQFQGGWALKVYPRYGLEDGVITPNIGQLYLPNVFGNLVEEMLQKITKNNIDDWNEFFVMCFDQFITMCSTTD